MKLLIQLRHHPIEESRWEEYDLLAGQFPSFCLEDKASFGGGGALIRPHLWGHILEKESVKRELESMELQMERVSQTLRTFHLDIIQ